MKNSLLIFAALIFCFAGMQAQTATATEVSKEDKLFARQATEGSLLEVKLGQLAKSHALSEEVLVNAELMVSSHDKDIDELVDLASKKSIVLPAEISGTMQKKYKRLSKLSGKKFDKQYIRLMIKDHEAGIAAFNKEIKTGKDPELKAWAGAKLPTLQLHLDMWKGACKAAKTRTAGKEVAK